MSLPGFPAEPQLGLCVAFFLNTFSRMYVYICEFFCECQLASPLLDIPISQRCQRRQHSSTDFPVRVEIYVWKIQCGCQPPSKDTSTDAGYVPLKCLPFDKSISKALLVPWLCQKA